MLIDTWCENQGVLVPVTDRSRQSAPHTENAR